MSSDVRIPTGPWWLTTAPRVWVTSPTLWTWTARESWGPWWSALAWAGSWGIRRQGWTPPGAEPAERPSPPSWTSLSVTRWRSWQPSTGLTFSSSTSAWRVSCPLAWTALCHDQGVTRRVMTQYWCSNGWMYVCTLYCSVLVECRKWMQYETSFYELKINLFYDDKLNVN